MAYIIVAIGALALGHFTTWSYAKFRLGEQEGKHKDEVRLLEFRLDNAEAQAKGAREALKVKGSTNEELEDKFSVNGGLYSVPKRSVH